jgi:hypothetical protein
MESIRYGGTRKETLGYGLGFGIDSGCGIFDGRGHGSGFTCGGGGDGLGYGCGEEGGGSSSGYNGWWCSAEAIVALGSEYMKDIGYWEGNGRGSGKGWGEISGIGG